MLFMLKFVYEESVIVEPIVEKGFCFQEINQEQMNAPKI